MYLAVLVVALSITGCGDDRAGDSTASDAATTEVTEPTGTEATEETTADDSEKPGKPPKVTGKLGEKPEIATPSGTPPRELIKKDLKKGTGRKAGVGDKVTMNYVGVSWSTGEQFDASWDRGQPFPFQLGTGAVIAGWDEGIVGMREGGRRLLVIPPNLGYGDAGQPPDIAGGETLVFVVDLEELIFE